MHLSHYLKKYPCKDKKGYYQIYSTKKGSLIDLHEDTFSAIEKGKLSRSEEELLLKLGMIVPDLQDEKQEVLNRLNSINANNSGLKITAVLNLDCNFACAYCFEGNMKAKLYMSENTADRMIAFIKKQFTENKKLLIIDFYGGEPLLSMGLIKYISNSVRTFTENRDALFNFTLVTNGSLFTRKTAEELVPLGLKSVQITLDGPAEMHDKSRPFKSGSGSFDTIIHNIKQTCDLVKVNIGGNFEQNNYEKFIKLLDYLMDADLTPDKISSVKFAPVTKRLDSRVSPNDFNDGCISINEPWLVKAGEVLREEILKRGYYTPKLMPMPCAIDIKDAYVINFDEAIYKCPAFIGKKGFDIGSLETGVKDYTSSYRLDLWKNKKCLDCEYLPLCYGGCRYMTLLREGNVDSLECKKPYLDASLETFLKQDIMYKHQGK